MKTKAEKKSAIDAFERCDWLKFSRTGGRVRPELNSSAKDSVFVHFMNIWILSTESKQSQNGGKNLNRGEKGIVPDVEFS